MAMKRFGRMALSFRRGITGFLAAVMASMLAACGGGGSTTNVQNPPAPTSTPVSIAFQTPPASTITLNATTSVSAVVTNDPNGAGVDWALTCNPKGNCGTISPLHTQSGESATYTSPSSSSGNGQAITIEAFATADHSQNVLASLSIIGFSASLKGTYVFGTQGVDINGGPFQLAGVVVLDGNGGIVGGEQTHSDFVISYSDAITGGIYAIGPDGRGTMTINTANQNIGQLGVENFSLVVLSISKAFIVTLDDPNLQPSSETSSGAMDLQTSTAAPTGGYAFVVNGTDINLAPMAIGGVMNIDSPNAISGAGSVADQDYSGSVFPNSALSGTLTSPDAYGSLQFTLTADFAVTPMVFTGYVVDGTHIRLIESDNTAGTGFGATGGQAISQGSSIGTFTKSAFAGNYVFGILGQDLTGFPVSLASAGNFTADSAGNLTNGYNDEYLSGFGTEISDSFTGTYTLDATGRVDSNINFDNNGPGPEFIFYLTGSGKPALVLDADLNIGSLGAGTAYPQAAAPLAFSGTYGMYFTQGAFGLEDDSTAAFTVDGTANTLSGTVDTNFLLSPLPDSEITGTFGNIPTSGRAPGTLTNTYFPSPGDPRNTLAVTYYLIDSEHGFFIETDSLVSGELLFGYYEQRTPSCNSCQLKHPTPSKAKPRHVATDAFVRPASEASTHNAGTDALRRK
jgi:hypothetical protein